MGHYTSKADAYFNEVHGGDDLPENDLSEAEGEEYEAIEYGMGDPDDVGDIIIRAPRGSSVYFFMVINMDTRNVVTSGTLQPRKGQNAVKVRVKPGQYVVKVFKHVRQNVVGVTPGQRTIV
jgi:hypothetical protein